jgi:single-strand DNA-binding protein
MNLNKVLFAGRLTRDPQLKYLSNQTPICEVGAVYNRKFRTQAGEDREEVCFVDCTAFGKTAEAINQHFLKGKEIFIEGHLKYDAWEDKNGGGKRSKLTIVIDQFQFVGPRTGDGGDASGGGDGGRPASHPSRPAARPARAGAGRPEADEGSFKDDDIPF